MLTARSVLCRLRVGASEHARYSISLWSRTTPVRHQTLCLPVAFPQRLGGLEPHQGRRWLGHACRHVVRCNANMPNVQPFMIHMQVRDSELDQFGVVNNAVYLNYLQHARHEFLEAAGISPDAIVRSGEGALALSELNMQFRAPLRSRDCFSVDVRIGKVSAARASLEQQIVRLPREPDQQPQVVLTATAVVVYLDTEYRPKRLSPMFRQVFVSDTSSETSEGK